MPRIADGTYRDYLLKQLTITMTQPALTSPKFAALGSMTLNYSGQGDSVTIPSQDTLNVEGDFTLELWMLPAADQPNPDTRNQIGQVVYLVTKFPGNDPPTGTSVGAFPYELAYFTPADTTNAGKIYARRSDGTTDDSLISDVTVNDGGFHHIAFVSNGSKLYLYVDGQQQTTPPGGVNELTGCGNTTNVTFGKRQYGTSGLFAGSLGWVRLWDGALGAGVHTAEGALQASMWSMPATAFDSMRSQMGMSAIPTPVQQLTVPSGTTGTFTLSYAGATTTPLASTANEAAVRSALQSLGTIGSGHVTCTGGSLGTAPISITLASSLQSSDLPIVPDSSALNRGTATVIEYIGGPRVIGDWRCNEGYGTTAYDYTSTGQGRFSFDGGLAGTYGNNGTLGGADPSPKWMVSSLLVPPFFHVDTPYIFAAQTITVTNATGGTFTLTFKQSTTGAIAFNASNTTVKSALEALATVESGNVEVTGTSVNSSEGVNVHFQNALDEYQPLLTADGSQLSGSTPAVTVTAVYSEPETGAGQSMKVQPESYQRRVVTVGLPALHSLVGSFLRAPGSSPARGRTVPTPSDATSLKAAGFTRGVRELEDAGIMSVDDLEDLLSTQQGDLTSIRGIGESKADAILTELEDYKQRTQV